MIRWLAALPAVCLVAGAFGPSFPARAAPPDAGALEPHIVAPQLTDPNIDQALDDQYAWLDRTAPTNHRLLVYLPGHEGVPANALLLQQQAARLGYHVIGLMYVDGFFLAGLCNGDVDPNSCFESALTPPFAPPSSSSPASRSNTCAVKIFVSKSIICWTCSGVGAEPCACPIVASFACCARSFTIGWNVPSGFFSVSRPSHIIVLR